MEQLLTTKTQNNIDRYGVPYAIKMSKSPLGLAEIAKQMDCPVILYSEIPADLHALLLDNPLHAVIILYRWQDMYGHFIACFINEHGIEVFDSTDSTGPDLLRDLQSPGMAKKLGQSKLRLLSGIRASGLDGNYNDKKLQSAGFETCGRWACLRVLFSKLSDEAFYKLLNKQSKRFGLPLDIIAVLATL